MATHLARAVKWLFQHPLTRDLDVDRGDVAIQAHRQLIHSKGLLHHQHVRWYEEFLPAVRETEHLSGTLLEIGCGAGFLEEYVPNLLKTDCCENPFAHRVVDAMDLPFPTGSVRAIFVLSVLHHLPSLARFLSEANRCLEPGGRLVMIEPSNNPTQRILVRVLDHYEYYDDQVAEWENTSTNRMLDANLALPWVVFVRDRARFEREFPNLHILGIRHHTFLSNVVTGGMTYRSFLPAAAAKGIDALEAATAPWMHRLGTMMTIDVVKRPAA